MTRQLATIQQERQDSNLGVCGGPRRGVAAIGAILLALACTSGAITPVAADFRSTPGPFYPATLLTPNLGYLTGIACPQVNTCYIAGSTSGSNPTGLVLRVTASAAHVTTHYGPSARAAGPIDPLSSIGCMDAIDCYAVGVNPYLDKTGNTELTATSDGTNWGVVVAPQPLGGLPTEYNNVTAIGCTTGFCMAVGSQSQSGTASTANQSAVWVSLATAQEPHTITPRCLALEFMQNE